VSSPLRIAFLDVETRCHVALARQVLGLDEAVPAADVCRRLAEKRRAENGGSFHKLPFHEPVAAAVLLAEMPSAGEPLLATGWRCLTSWGQDAGQVESLVGGFFEAVAGRLYVGFNSQAFDLPLMELWASRLSIGAPDHFSDPAASPRQRRAAERHCDLQKELVNWAPGSGTFDELCKFHGLPGKPGVSGDEVEALVHQGRFDEILAYNVTDVVQTSLLYLHVLVRSGTLRRDHAGLSARLILELTGRDVSARLPEGSAARLMLETSLVACSRTPIARF